MPWQPTGNFLRTNNQFTGVTVWEQDQQASIKIIASRHDFHDEDLATGIEQCLNVDGYNKMLAPLDMNGFEIINLANIVQGTFTPTLYLAAGTTVTGQMFWHRAGNLVTVFGRVEWAAAPTNNIDHIQIAGLPYNIPNDAGKLGNGTCARVEQVAWGNLISLKGVAEGADAENNLSALGLQGIQNTDRIGLYDSFSVYSNQHAGLSPIVQYGVVISNGYLEIQFTYSTDDPI